MITYPISVKRNSYRGSDVRKKARAASENQIATQLERHINAQLLSQTEPIKTYLYSIIAAETGFSEEIIRNLCLSVECGHNGFTAIKHGMTREEAMCGELRSDE